MYIWINKEGAQPFPFRRTWHCKMGIWLNLLLTRTTMKSPKNSAGKRSACVFLTALGNEPGRSAELRCRNDAQWGHREVWSIPSPSPASRRRSPSRFPAVLTQLQTGARALGTQSTAGAKPWLAPRARPELTITHRQFPDKTRQVMPEPCQERSGR